MGDKSTTAYVFVMRICLAQGCWKKHVQVRFYIKVILFFSSVD